MQTYHIGHHRPTPLTDGTRTHDNHGTAPGFTLIELSIVLVIIGLLVGGVLVGRDLIRAAELRSVMSDVERFKTAINTFRLKYNCIPGDCLNATDYFGTGSGGCPTGARTGTQTCNGNGNGMIDLGVGQSPAFDTSAAANIETFLIWQHLGAAQLIQGTYTGVPGSTNNYNHLLGTNCPMSRIAGAGYEFLDETLFPPDANLYAVYSGPMLIFGSQSFDGQMWNPTAIASIDAYSIDSKMDDGLPASGVIVSYTHTFAPNCATSDNPVAASYSNNTNKGCAVIYRNMY